jgi:hydroxypyruvate reductase
MRDEQTLSILDVDYDLERYETIVVVGGGKAASGVTKELESGLDGWIDDVLIISNALTDTQRVRHVIGHHPIPSQRDVTATNQLLGIVDADPANSLVLFVLTGGASALLSSPAGELTLADSQKTTERLLEAGVAIDEINAVRKHLSSIKGGQLVRRAAPADISGLLVSDVVGNNLWTIGSGAKVPDATTFKDAHEVIDRHTIDVPRAVVDHLQTAVHHRITETPFPEDPVLETVDNHLIGSNAIALEAVRSVALAADYQPLFLSSRLRSEAPEVGMALVAIGEEIAATGNPIEPPAVVFAGGEMTVTIAGDGGQGGPNQELVLSGALELEGPQILAAVDTDGEDGRSAVAGAIANETTVTDISSARDRLARNDAGT